MQEVELTRRSEEEESNAQNLFNSGAIEATGLVDLMKRVNKQGELPLYYGGGLRLIKEALKNGEELFYLPYALILSLEKSICFADHLII